MRKVEWSNKINGLRKTLQQAYDGAKGNPVELRALRTKVAQQVDELAYGRCS
jgi:hypothetical protein